MVTLPQQDELRAAIGPRFIKRLNHSAGTARVKDGLGIAPLRATGGPPSAAPAPLQAAPGPGLLDLPESGEGMLSRLGAQTSAVSPLTAGLGQEEGPPALHALQTGALNLRRHLQQSGNQSRLLAAAANPRRSQGGFALQFSAATIDLLG
jgi:hypothetical protein